MMSRTICLHYEQVCNYIDNDPHFIQWYDYCRHHHCEICEDNNLNCITCKDYVSGMHIATECIYYGNCMAQTLNGGICTDKMARDCQGYKEE